MTNKTAAYPRGRAAFFLSLPQIPREPIVKSATKYAGRFNDQRASETGNPFPPCTPKRPLFLACMCVASLYIYTYSGLFPPLSRLHSSPRARRVSRKGRNSRIQYLARARLYIRCYAERPFKSGRIADERGITRMNTDTKCSLLGLSLSRPLFSLSRPYKKRTNRISMLSSLSLVPTSLPRFIRAHAHLRIYVSLYVYIYT